MRVSTRISHAKEQRTNDYRPGALGGPAYGYVLRLAADCPHARCPWPVVIASLLNSLSETLLLDDPDLDLRVDVGVEANGNAVDAERANGLMQLDLALFDWKALCLELMRNVGRRD